MSELDLISVVVPIYNVQKYLEECLISICNQTYKQLEIILVDDGSTDNSGKICDKYKQLDSRIQVIHKENGGLSDARNTGLKYSNGNYIVFIDSDDYISFEMIERMLEYKEKYQADIVMCQYFNVYKNQEHEFVTEDKESIQMTGEEAFYEFLVGNLPGMVVAWNKLYDIKLFKDNKIQYPKGKIHEDCYTTYKLYLKADRVVYLYDKMYAYRHRKGSITQAIDLNKEYMIVEAYKEIMDTTAEWKDKFLTQIEYRYLISNLQYISHVRNIGQMKYIYKAQKNVCSINYQKNMLLKGQQKMRIYILAFFPIIVIPMNITINFIKKILENYR